MEIEKKKIKEIDRAEYNPRVELRPGDREYENLKASIERHGLVEPIVWNRRTNRVVGGHQRLTVLENEGEKEVEVSVVDLDEVKEKQLNIALNKVQGSWDEDKLSELLKELGEDAILTGFTQEEIDDLTFDIDQFLDEQEKDADFWSELDEIYTVTLRFDKADKPDIDQYIREHGKGSLVETIVKKAKGEM